MDRDDELRFLEVQNNYAAAMVALGADFDILRIKRFLILNGGGYTQVSLSALLDIPRRTLGKRVKQCVEWGALSIQSDGIHLTDGGRAMLLAVHSEALRIAHGQQRGFSLELVNSYAAVAPDRCDPSKAMAITFKH